MATELDSPARWIERAVMLLAIAALVGCGAGTATRPPVDDAGSLPPDRDRAVVESPDPEVPTGDTPSTAVVPNGGWRPAWSPDGEWIAFLSSTLHVPSDLWVVRPSGTDARRVTTRGADAFRWSSDGASIQFSANRRGFDELLEVETTAGDESRIEDLPPGATLPVYSPDGELFAFTAPGEGGVRDLWIATADGERMDAVTEKLGVRSVFWGPGSRKVYFEPGKAYGVGLWELDLSTMQSKVILNSYIGTPRFSSVSGRIAYPYPTNPGEFSVHTCAPDGSDDRSFDAPRLVGRDLDWDADGTGVYYIGGDLDPEAADHDPSAQPTDAPPSDAGESDYSLPPGHSATDRPRSAASRVNSIWRLDLTSGDETRISPNDLHVVEFEISPDGNSMVVAGLLPTSVSSELFSLDLSTQQLNPIVSSRPSSWMPVPNRESSKIAYFTNASGIDTIEVVTPEGERVTSYPGIVEEGDTRLFWLPQSEALMLFSSRGLIAFDEDGPIAFPDRKDHRAYLFADVSIQSDRVMITTIPRYGVTPGLYMLKAVDGVFEQTDLRYPSAPEVAADLYLQPKWSFDERRVAFTDKIDLWVMNADGTGRKWITDFATSNADEANGPPNVATFPAWSVDGEWIAHTRLVYEKEFVLRQLWIIRADGSDERMLFSQPVDSAGALRLEGFTNLPFFDVTDERVIFSVVDDGVPNLMAVSLADGELHRLTSTGAIFPVLLPEDDLVVYTSLEGGAESLWVMNSDGTEKHPFRISTAAHEAGRSTPRSASRGDS